MSHMAVAAKVKIFQKCIWLESEELIEVEVAVDTKQEPARLEAETKVKVT